jgi:hypothetical protein
MWTNVKKQGYLCAYPTGGYATVGTYPKCHAQMLAKVPKTSPEYPNSHDQMLAKVPKMQPKYPKSHAQMLAKVLKIQPKCPKSHDHMLGESAQNAVPKIPKMHRPVPAPRRCWGSSRRSCR